MQRSLPRHALLTLVRALVVSKVDYCISCLGRNFWKFTELVAVFTECRRSAHLFSQEVKAHNPTASGTSLVACSRAPAYLAYSLQLTADAPARRCLRSTDMMMLQVPLMRRSTISDRAFPVAAARAWNSLPPATRAANSLLQFRRETKAQLFRQSFLD